MGVIKVDVYPPDTMGSATISTDLTCDAKTVFKALVTRYGDGTLWDHNGRLVWTSQLPYRARQLDAGDYTFFKSAQGQGKFKWLFWCKPKERKVPEVHVNVLPIQVTPPTPVSTSVWQASLADVGSALDDSGYTTVDGDVIAPFKTPIPPGTPPCEHFDSGLYPSKDAAVPALAQHHRAQLAKMGVPMDEYDVVDLHESRDLPALVVDDQSYRAEVDCALVSRAAAQAGDAASHIRVGFVHFQTPEQRLRFAREHGARMGTTSSSEERALRAAQVATVMTALAVLHEEGPPQDFVTTNGARFDLWRFQEDFLLHYEIVDAQRVYFELARKLFLEAAAGRAAREQGICNQEGCTAIRAEIKESDAL